ncbi:MAG: VWA domain-containing protein, partial [Bryobacterales bacterium]|nr:VWA domain-containing protein [Bryobacterales bacterium]
MLLRSLPTLAAAVVLVPAWAQENGRPEFEPVYAGQDSDIIKVDVARVPLLFTVTDRRNRFITDLGRDDFAVFDNGWQQEIREFDRESDLSLRIGVVLDP